MMMKILAELFQKIVQSGTVIHAFTVMLSVFEGEREGKILLHPLGLPLSKINIIPPTLRKFDIGSKTSGFTGQKKESMTD
jgi:hypothetical protein